MLLNDECFSDGLVLTKQTTVNDSKQRCLDFERNVKLWFTVKITFLIKRTRGKSSRHQATLMRHSAGWTCANPTWMRCMLQLLKIHYYNEINGSLSLQYCPFNVFEGLLPTSSTAKIQMMMKVLLLRLKSSWAAFKHSPHALPPADLSHVNLYILLQSSVYSSQRLHCYWALSVICSLMDSLSLRRSDQTRVVFFHTHL